MHKNIGSINLDNFVAHINCVYVLLGNFTKPCMYTMQFVFRKSIVASYTIIAYKNCSLFWTNLRNVQKKLPLSLTSTCFSSVCTILNWPAKCIFNSMNEPSTVGMLNTQRNPPQEIKTNAISKFGDVVISNGYLKMLVIISFKANKWITCLR